ncbi:MAG: heme-binding protein, partial [Pseudomonadota bacterium]
ARAYRGGWSEDRYEKEEAALLDAIAADGLTACAEPVWARFDPPFMPSFWRTNEILIEVSDGACTTQNASANASAS